MVKKFTLFFCVFAAVLFIVFQPIEASAQSGCATTSWTLTPAPVNGAYDAGQTVHVCLTMTYYNQTSANWVHGFEINFPAGWDYSSIANQTAPVSCDGGGTWGWYESVTGNDGTYGPGWFYDQNPGDGNPGNNYGDFCTNFSANFTFCMDITLAADCGGGGSPLDGAIITPEIVILGDGESGSWINGNAACGEVAVQPDLPNIPTGEITLNCCDAESGTPPSGPVDICGTVPFDMLTLLGPPVSTPGTWSGPAGWSGNGATASAMFDPNTDGPGDYTFSVIGTDGCVNSSTITMQYIDYGQQAVTGYCDSNPASIFDLWTNPNFTLTQPGEWYDPNGVLVDNDSLDPAIHPSGLYVYEFSDNGCPATVSFDITIATGGSTGSLVAGIDVCTLDPCFALMDSLAITPYPGAIWLYYDTADNYLQSFDITDTLCPSDYNGAGADVESGYIVYFSMVPPCPLTTDTLYIDAYEPFDPGLPTEATICTTDPPLDLTTLLDGTPDAGGNWLDLGNGNAPVPQPFDPASVAPNQVYYFNYEGGLNGTLCAASQLLTLTVLSDQTDAGTSNSVTVCTSVGSFNMTDSLLGTPQPGGVWTNAIGDTIPGDLYVPSAYSPGVYTYSINSSCGSDQATLTVSESTPPDPGTNGILDICSGDVAVPLINGLGGTPFGTGTWLPYGPNVDGNTVSDGDIFTYVTGDPGCQATAQVLINLVPSNDPGVLIPGPYGFCDTEGPADLFTYFDTPPSVSNPSYWSGPAGFTGNIINPAVASSGTYTYTIPDNGCGAATISMFISIETPAFAGVTTAYNICSSATDSVDLAGVLGNPDPNGNWSSVPTGGPTNGWFNPGDPAGIYTYTAYSQPDSFCVSTASAAVSYINLPNPGTDTTITVCENDPPFMMTTGGTPDPGGIWTSGTAQFIPGTTAPGAFDYSFPGGGSCPDAAATVTVVVNPTPDAGNNSNAQVCESAGTIDLPSYISGTPDTGGTWNNLTTGQYDVSDQFDVSTYGGSSLTFEYEVTVGNCSDLSTLIVNVYQAPNAGPDVTETLCGDGSMFNLDNIIDVAADAPGNFIDPLNNPVPGNVIALTAANAGVYTYEVPGGATCPDDQAQYTINIEAPLSVANLNTNCNAAQTAYTVSFEISGGDGNYVVTGLTGTLNSSVSPAVFTSDEIAGGNPYSYTITDGGPCPDIVVGNQPGPICNCGATADWTGGNVTICEGQSVNLALEFTGTAPFYIDYTDGTNPVDNAGPFITGDFITVTPSATTTYIITEVTDGNCFTSTNDAITVTVETTPNAGPDVSESLCAGGILNLMTLVDPNNADTDGIFTGPVTVTNNSVPQTAASSGIYTYTTSGTQCPDDDAQYIIDIYAPLSVSVADVQCSPNQLGYTVSFEISGGDGNYTITEAGGFTGTQSGTNPTVFNSQQIPNGNDFNFTVSDGSPCASVGVQGLDPQCDCPAGVSLSGNTAICLGECAELTFDFVGDGPFSVTYENSANPNNPTTLTGLSAQHMVTVCPNATTTYTVTAVSDANCDGFNLGNPVTVTVDQPITVSNVQTNCGPNYEYYTLTFDIAGGTPSNYVVTSNVSGIGNGSVNAGQYTSALIPSGTAYNFTVGDNGACPTVDVEGSFTCPCITDAGSLQGGLSEVCDGSAAAPIPNGDDILDGNDLYQFVLHDGNATTIGTVLATSATGAFTYVPSLTYGVTYYITAVAGNNDGTGGVDMSHPCASQSNGVPVVFYPQPEAVISGGANVCEGTQVSFDISFTGTGPWLFDYSLNGEVQGSLSAPNSSYSLPAVEPGSYTVPSVTDGHCSGTGSGMAQLFNFETPTATLSGDPEVCEGSGDGPELSLTGNGPWTVVYSFDGIVQDPIVTSSANLVIPATEDGLFSLVSVSDVNCTGDVSGSLEVTMLEAPTATLTGGGTVCEGDELPFTLNLTGDGPWTVQYAVDGVPQPPIIVDESSPSYSFDSGIGGNYTLTAVNDQNCPGQTLTSLASLTVNPVPSADILPNTDEICLGESLDITFDLQGNPPFDFTYVINGDTTALTGLGTSYFQTISPTAPVFVEVLSLTDGSVPSCVNTEGSSLYIPIYDLPAVPVLADDTICADSGPIAIGVDAEPGMNYSWYPASRLSDPNVANPTFAPTGFFPDVKTFEYILTANDGTCSTSDTMTVTVDPGPRARFEFDPDPVRTEDTKVYFNNLTPGNGALLYFWEFDSLGTSTAASPIFEFPSGLVAEYTVTLTVTDPYTGCTSVSKDEVIVRPEMLAYVPNAFTPNSDGVNDVWGPVLTNIDDKDYRLTVYDRLGEVVFSTRDPNKKWNGGMNGSEYYVKTGVYIWIIETKNPTTQEDYNFQGKVSVVR